MPKSPQRQTQFTPDKVQEPREVKPMGIKQQIHFLSLKASSTDGYEQALMALQGTITAITTTPQHLIVITE